MVDPQREIAVIETAGDRRHHRRTAACFDIAGQITTGHLATRRKAVGQRGAQRQASQIAAIRRGPGQGDEFFCPGRIGNRTFAGDTQGVAAAEDIECRAFGHHLDTGRPCQHDGLQLTRAVKALGTADRRLRVGETAGEDHHRILRRRVGFNEQLGRDRQQIVWIGELDEHLAVFGRAGHALGLRHIGEDVVLYPIGDFVLADAPAIAGGVADSGGTHPFDLGGQDWHSRSPEMQKPRTGRGWSCVNAGKIRTLRR